MRLHEIAKRLTMSGHKITLLCERVIGFPTDDNIDGIKVLRLGNRFSLHLLAPLYVRDHGVEFDAIVDDIAHAVPWYSSLVTSTPTIAQIHHIHQEVLKIELPAPMSWFVGQLERSIAKIYRNFIAVSPSTKRELIKTLKIRQDRILVVPNGVDLSMYKPGVKESRPTILWVGRVKKYKRLDHLLRAFKIVKRKMQDAQLIVVGSGDQLRSVMKLAEAMGLRDVKFLGRVTNDEKISLMQRAWIITSTSVIEGWGMTILEAAACQTPTVAYGVQGILDSVVNGVTGILVTPGNVVELAEAIVKVLKDDGLRRYLEYNAFMRAQNYDWSLISKRFEKSLLHFLQCQDSQGTVVNCSLSKGYD